MTKIITQNIYLIPMLISAIFSLKAFRLKWPLAYRIFSIYLFIALITDVLGTLWRVYLFQFKEWTPFGAEYNSWILTFSIAPQYLFLMAVYYEVLKSKKIKKAIHFIAIGFTFFVIINFTFGQGIKAINSLSHLIADAIMLLLVYFYVEQLRTQNELVKLTEQPMIWISLGVFIFHLLNIPLLYCLDYLYHSNKATAVSFMQFYRLIIFLTYTLFIKAFLCPTPRRK